jgi:hypothetical protein
MSSNIRTPKGVYQFRYFFSIWLFPLPFKNFPAFDFPCLSVLRISEIHPELFGNLFKRELGIVGVVVAEVGEHFDLFKIKSGFVNPQPFVAAVHERSLKNDFCSVDEGPTILNIESMKAATSNRASSGFLDFHRVRIRVFQPCCQASSKTRTTILERSAVRTLSSTSVNRATAFGSAPAIARSWLTWGAELIL